MKSLNPEQGLSIVIPTYNRGPRLKILLRSMLEMIQAEEMQVEIIVVSNLEDMAVSQIVAEFKASLDIHLFVAGRVGINSARNLGMSKATKDICFFIDDDCILNSPIWYLELLQTFELTKAVAVGGLLVPAGPISLPGKAYYISILSWLIRYSRPRSMQAYRLVGGCFAVSRSRLGGLKFDDEIVFGGDESSLTLQLVAQDKLILLNTRISIGHDFNISFSEMFIKAYKFGKFHDTMKQEMHKTFPEQKRSYSEIEAILTRRFGKNKMYIEALKFTLKTRALAFSLPRFTKLLK